tara:strand:+ start:3475 stop:5061 length:1587 start_codon:yes stop_codon:yes gene_type:complete
MVEIMWKGSLVANIGEPNHLIIQKEFLLSKFMGSEADAIEYTINSIYPNFIELTEQQTGKKLSNEEIKRVVSQAKAQLKKIEKMGIEKIIKDVQLPDGNRNKRIMRTLDKPYPDVTVSESSDTRKQAEFSGNLSEKVVSRRQDKRLSDMLEGKYKMTKGEFNSIYGIDSLKTTGKKVNVAGGSSVSFTIDKVATKDSVNYKLTMLFNLVPDISAQKTILRSEGLSNVAYNEIIDESKSSLRERAEEDWYKGSRVRQNIEQHMSQYDKRTSYNQLIADLQADLVKRKADLKRSKAYEEASKTKKVSLEREYVRDLKDRLKTLKKQRDDFKKRQQKAERDIDLVTTFAIPIDLQKQVIDKAKSDAGEPIKRKIRTEEQLRKKFQKAMLATGNKAIFDKLNLYDILREGSDVINAHYATNAVIGLQLDLGNTSEVKDKVKLKVLLKVTHLGELDVLQHRRFLQGKFTAGTQVRTDLEGRYGKIGPEKYLDAPSSPIRDLLVKSVSAKYEKLERKIQKMEETVNRVLGERDD